MAHPMRMPVSPFIAMMEITPKTIKSQTESRIESRDIVVALTSDGIMSLLSCE